MGRICLWPNCLGPDVSFEFRVPVDDENTLSIHWFFIRVPNEQEPYEQKSIPAWEGPLVDPLTGRFYSSHVTNQDFIAWVGQGKVADRTKEMLAPSDRGIILMRKRFLDDIARVERGEDPSGLVRDPKINEGGIGLPIIHKEMLVNGMPMAEMLADPSLDPRAGYIAQAGQPLWVRRQFLEAMGLDPDTQQHEGGSSFLLAGATNRPGTLNWT